MLSEGSSVKRSPEDKQASAPYIRGSAKISRRVTLARFTGDVVMVCTNWFMGKHKVNDQWHEGGYVVVEQLDNWPVYRVKCLPIGNCCKHTYQILHWNCLMLVPSEDDSPHDAMPLPVVTAIVLNADIEAILGKVDSVQESKWIFPSLLTRQSGEQTSHVWLNGEFHTKPWTQMESSLTKCSPSLEEDEVSEPEPTSSGSEEEED